MALESLSVGAEDMGKGKAAMAYTGRTGHAEYVSLLLPSTGGGSGLENMSDNLEHNILCYFNFISKRAPCWTPQVLQLQSERLKCTSVISC